MSLLTKPTNDEDNHNSGKWIQRIVIIVGSVVAFGFLVGALRAL
jgi:hypothetical protein